ncbi:hypothetical protein NDU88_002172 [Pleurodeles waltl]|uniref:Uncharacterized protein n=1 Tax=Pleurodeles waltl TaxID=8319 RepID=A0AAV7LDI1_PLEWA|nr:hypothetical protein NDU88_002172 [Pleurodeles waltl]
MVWQAGRRQLPTQGPSWCSLKTAMHRSPPQTLSREPCHLVGWRANPRKEAPTLGPAGVPEPKLTGEALLGPVDFQAWAPQGTAGWREVVPVPGPVRGQGPSQSSLNTAMHGSLPQTLSQVPCHLVGRRAKPRIGAPNTMPTRAPEPKLTGESSLGPVYSQAWAPQGTAGWRKGTPALGPSGGPTRAPEAKLAGEASPGWVDSQA